MAKCDITKLILALTLLSSGVTFAQDAPRMKMSTETPPDLITPNKVDTRLGELRFFDGFPDKDTVQKVYDNLDFQRGVEVFLNSMPGASLYAMREGLRNVGVNNHTVVVFETLMDSKSLFLTPNTDTVYLIGWLDLKDGPLVVESPPNTLGILDDFWFRYVTDMGNAGPDKGKGGKFLVVPPGYTGEAPAGYFVAKSRTYGVWLISRGFLVNKDPKPAVESFKKNMRIYPLSQAANPPETKFINVSGKYFNTIHSSNEKFYEEVNAIVQEEPTEAQDPELLGQLLGIGIAKGKPFAPDERMQKILKDAAAVGNATARAIEFSSREQGGAYYYPGKAWYSPSNPDGSYLWLQNGARNLDARTMMFFGYTGVTPAMFQEMVGIGSQYAVASVDTDKNHLEGAKTYRLHLPPNVPAKTFWSVVVYDIQTRSELQTDSRFPSLGSNSPDIEKNPDGSYDVYFGPTAPAGKAGNWVQTVPGKGWWVILRLYGPLEPWFDKTWQPGELELSK